MADSKAAAQLIKELKKIGKQKDADGNPKLRLDLLGESRRKVWVGKQFVVIPHEKARTSARAIRNARAELRRVLGLDV